MKMVVRGFMASQTAEVRRCRGPADYQYPKNEQAWVGGCGSNHEAECQLPHPQGMGCRWNISQTTSGTLILTALL